MLIIFLYQILGWLNVIESHRALGLDFPVNLKMCFEGMEESGSEGLDDLIEDQKDKFFKGTDAVCISDNYWCVLLRFLLQLFPFASRATRPDLLFGPPRMVLRRLNTTTPCLTYGLRGIAYFALKISGPARDLHSGVFGGSTHEPMTDLITILSTLVLPNGKILIPGLAELVAPLKPGELERYENINFSIADIENASVRLSSPSRVSTLLIPFLSDLLNSTGSKTTISTDKVQTLMSRMREPSLSLHGIEGAFYSPGAKTVIPASVTGELHLF